MLLQSRNVYFNEKLQPLQLEIKDGEIINLLPYGCHENVIDYSEAILLPGLVDIHNHGYCGGECNAATKEWLKKWTAYLPSEGVTSTLFTFSSGDPDKIDNSLLCYKAFCEEGYEGTRLIGAYSEGPFVGGMPGAQRPEYKLVPTPEIIDKYIEESGGRLRYVMVAPEKLKGNYSVISYCRQKGIAVALGHTAADFGTCADAIAAGATSFTHTYNGMRGLHHREPGVVGAAMVHDDCYAELICDGRHVHPAAANILAKIKGKDKLILITDSVSLKGLEPGEYGESGHPIILESNGSIHLPDGTICGSSNRLNKVLNFAIKEAKIDPVTACNACTKNPCEMLGLENKGKIAIGYDADIAVFDDDYNVLATYIEGKKY